MQTKRRCKCAVPDHRNHTVITYRSKAWRGAASAVPRRFFHGTWIRTFTIITTDADELVAEIHDRMPLILAPSVPALTEDSQGWANQS
jgi:putative SOS response-associated peptidase YedK